MTIPRTSRALLAALVAASLLAACGGGSDDASPTTTTTTAAAEEATTIEADAAPTTTEAEGDDEEEAPDDVITDESEAPSGAWISVRFLAGIDPEPADWQPGEGGARLYDITPDCDDDGCVLTFEGGGPDGSFALPDVEPITGEPIVMEPDGARWTSSYDYPDAIGCTPELDGPYLDTSEERELEAVFGEDGEVIGLVGTTVFVDTLTEEGRAAGCPASVEATSGFVTVMAPNDGIAALDGYEVDGEFRQTVEVTESSGYTDAGYVVGGSNTTLEGHDVTLEGSCEDGSCSVDFSQINGDGAVRETELLSEDGLRLVGTFEERGGCRDDVTGETLFENSAYDSTGAYEDLIPVWVEDGEVKAFVGRYYFVATPTELGMTEPSCSYEQTLGGWAYLVDTSLFEG